MIIEKINADYISAFKEKNTLKKNILGVVKGEVQTAEKKGVLTTDESVIAVLKKIEKGLKESIEKGDESAKAELEIISQYLPSQMEEEEIKNILKGYLTSGATPNLGYLMGSFNRDHKGKADNKLVSSVANQLLKEGV